MSKEDIQRMVDEAKANEAADKNREELAKAKNQAEHTCHQMRRMLDEHKDKLEGSEKEKIEAAIAEVEKVKAGEDKAAIEDSVKALEHAAQEFGKRVYSAQQQAAQGAAGGSAGPQPGPGPGPAAGGGKDDNIKDADFTVQK
jgi:molecular chaperone DnaK